MIKRNHSTGKMPRPGNLMFNMLTEIMAHCQPEFLKRLYLKVIFSLHAYTLKPSKSRSVYKKTIFEVASLLGIAHVTHGSKQTSYIIILEFRHISVTGSMIK